MLDKSNFREEKGFICLFVFSCFLIGSQFEGRVHHGSELMAETILLALVAGAETTAEFSAVMNQGVIETCRLCLSPFHSGQTLVIGMVLPTFRVGLPTSVKSLKTHHRHTQSLSPRRA